MQQFINHKSFRLTILTFIILFNLGCDKDKTVLNLETLKVTVAVQESTITVMNKTEQTIYYAIFPKIILPLIDWAPCTDPKCETQITPSKFINVSIDEVLDETIDDELILYWWHLIQENDEWTFDEIRSVDIDLSDDIKKLSVEDLKQEYEIVNNLNAQSNEELDPKLLKYKTLIGIDIRNNKMVVRRCEDRLLGCIMQSNYFGLFYDNCDSLCCEATSGLHVIDHEGFAGTPKYIGCAPDTL